MGTLCRTTRGAKAKHLKDTIKVKGLEFIQVDDIATDDLTEALKGMSCQDDPMTFDPHPFAQASTLSSTSLLLFPDAHP